MSEDILLSTSDGIATVTFNRPSQRNAISYHGWLELRRIAVELEHDSDVKVVVFTGAGEAAFLSGGRHQGLRVVPQQLDDGQGLL